MVSRVADDVEVAEILKRLPSGLLAALRAAKEENGALCLDLVHVRYSDAHALTGAGLVTAEGPWGTAPFVLTELGVRVRKELLAKPEETTSSSSGWELADRFGGHP